MVVKLGAQYRASFLSLLLMFAPTLAAQEGATSPVRAVDPVNTASQPIASSDASPGPLAVRDQTRYVVSSGDVLGIWCMACLKST